MRLVDLNPKFLDEHGGRTGAGVQFDCPCGCESPCYISFDVALDGQKSDGHVWRRVGDTFDTLTLTPSIQRLQPCPKQWHGFITNGEIVTV